MLGAKEAEMESVEVRTQPAWFTAPRFTFLLCFMLFWVYVDRGAFSSTSINGTPRSVENPKGSGIQGLYDLSNFEDGLLSSVFMIGMLIASPLFSEMVHRVNAMRVLGWGMGIWMLAVLGSGLSWNYPSLVVFRSFVGFGEAAVVALSPPFIDDHAPPKRKGLWLGFLYTSIPLGIGFGYILGGILGAAYNWRLVFLVEAGVILPLVLFTLFATPVDLRKTEGASTRTEEGSVIEQFFDHLGIVLSHPVYIITLAAYTIYTGVVGLVAYWGPKAAYAMFQIKDVDIFMGSTAALTGIGGTIVGGIILDQVGSSIPRALTLSCAATIGAVCFLIPSFMLATSFAWFCGPFSVTAILLFLIQAPVNAVFLWSVPVDQRALAASTSVVAIHLFGDVPSPAAYGALLDSMQVLLNDEGQAYRQTMTIVGACLFVSGVILFAAAVVARKAVDYREVEEESGLQNEEYASDEFESSQSEDLNSHRINPSDLEEAPLIRSRNT